MGRIQEIKSYRGTVKVVSDRSKIMNYSRSEPRWSVAVDVFGQQVWGEGDTKEGAAANALTMLPAHLRRHFSV